MSLRYKVSPDLVDGEHWSVVDTPAQLIELILEWTKQFNGDRHDVGESFEVEIVDMSDEEVSNLPNI